MMRKMDSTTERVVSLPTLAALRSTRMPSKQPTSAIMNANTGALMRPTSSVFTVIAPSSSRMKAGNGDAQIEIAHHHAADDAHDVGEEGEQRQRDHEAEHARQHQHLGDVEADGLHRVDFFVHLHGADLRGERRTGTARHDDGGDQPAQLAQESDAEKIDGEDFRAEARN